LAKYLQTMVIVLLVILFSGACFQCNTWRWGAGRLDNYWLSSTWHFKA